jgi:hypothetical protein
VAEVRRIQDRYRNVERRVFGPREREPDPARLPPCEILHIAADLLTDDQSAWRSEIRFDGPLSAPEWSARRIAACRLSTRLTVLSGCASAGTAPAGAEGLLGLSSAFLSAGSQAVVATLWPVDDRATLALTSRFYSMLAQGRTAAEALRFAQESMQGNPRTRSCFYWAGFVLIGDGSVSLPVESRPHREWIVAAVCLGLVVLLAWIGLRTGRDFEGGSSGGPRRRASG